MTSTIVLDFDGVVCDGLEECLLIAWNSFHGKGVDAFGFHGLVEIPQHFVDSFAHCRNFVRHSGHFLVPFFHSDGAIITSQAEFDEAYASLPEDKVRDFMAGFNEYRDRMRAERARDWLDRHTLYAGMIEVFRTRGRSIYIVTGKDQASVLAILRNAEVDFPADRVYGDQVSKIAALHDIARREGVTPAQLHFFDDNVPNVIDASKAGVTATWATWGYSTPEHGTLAAAANVPSISLPEFLDRLCA